MEPSGPVSLEDLEADLALSDDDISQDVWPPLPPGTHDTLVPGAVAPSTSGLPTPSDQHLPAQAPSFKRRLTSVSDSNSEPRLPLPSPPSSRSPVLLSSVHLARIAVLLTLHTAWIS